MADEYDDAFRAGQFLSRRLMQKSEGGTLYTWFLWAWDLLPVLVFAIYLASWCLFFALRVALTSTLIAEQYHWNVTRNETCSSPMMMAQFPVECQEIRHSVRNGLWATAFWDVWEHSTPCGGHSCLTLVFGEWTLVGVTSKIVAIASIGYLFVSFVRVVDVSVRKYSNYVKTEKQRKLEQRFRPR